MQKVLFYVIKSYNEEITDMTNIDQISICSDWLSRQKITKTINTNRTAYGYKHIIERLYGVYIEEKSFIEACKLMNIRGNKNNCLTIARNLV